MTTPADKEIVQSIRDRFQFLAVVTLFFPVTLQTVFSAFQNAIETNRILTSWGVVVAILVLNYLVIEYLRNKMSTMVARVANILIMLAIVCYIPVFLVFSMFNASWIPYLYGIAFFAGIIGTMVLPTALFLFLSGYIPIYFLKREKM